MQYEKAFKEEALSLSDKIGPTKASRQLNVPYYTIIDWRKTRKDSISEQGNISPMAEKAEQEKFVYAEIQKIKEENQYLSEENAALRRAIHFLSRQNCQEEK